MLYVNDHQLETQMIFGSFTYDSVRSHHVNMYNMYSDKTTRGVTVSIRIGLKSSHMRDCEIWQVTQNGTHA